MRGEEYANRARRMRHKSVFHSLFFAFCLLLVLAGIRLYVAEPLHISTGSMETALHKGDYVLVNKLPFANQPERNKIMLFTSPLLRDSLTSPLLISRCIAIPGDTVQVNPDGYSVNGREYPRSPNALNTYFMPNEGKALFLDLIKKLRIPLRDLRAERTGITLTLTSFEEYQIREELPAEFREEFHVRQEPSYRFVLPRKGRAYKLDSLSLLACREAILQETNGRAVFRSGKLYMEGKETNFFFFRRDYYWFLSDNVAEAVDSRHVGVVPEDCLIGRIFFCWYSSDRERRFRLI